MRKKFLQFHIPEIDNRELSNVQDALNSCWITTGPKTKEFEKLFANAVHADHAVAVNSCTAAMHLALEAIGVQAGDEVITSPYTFASSAEVIRYFDAVPVFADIKANNFNIDPECIQSSITNKTKAIIPVHIGGLAADLDAVNQIAQKHNLHVIEDAAHAFPSKYNHKIIGSISDFTCFSFYATKPITTAEGGMICTNNKEWAERCRIMSLHGISKDAWKRYTAEGSWYYEIIEPGYKYNMTDIAAAVGLAQLKKADRMWKRRKRIAAQYNTAFKEYKELQIPHDDPRHQHSWHLYMLRLHLNAMKIDRAQFIKELNARHIGVSVHFIPLHIHPYYKQKYGYKAEDFPIAYQEYQREVSLPIYSKMTDQDIQDVIDAVADIVKKFSK